MRYSRAIFAALRHAVVTAAVLALPSITWAATRGPDAAGYSATDATVYSFVDISGSSGGASILSGTDDGATGLSLPFTFSFYGQSYSRVCVSVNGALYFVADLAQCSGINDFANSDLTGSTPENDPAAVFPFWSDLTFQAAGAGSVYYQVLGTAGSRRFVVQWSNAFPQGSANPVTFQAILSEGTNRILFQYQVTALGDADPASLGGTATIGIRNSGGLVSGQQLPWSYNAQVVPNESAILFTPPGLTTPVITWANPASIPYGRALGPAQLNAVADVAGTFSYTPPAGTVLNAGNGQLLSVQFTPTDTAHYTTANATASIDITPAATTTALYGLPPSVGMLQPIALIAVVTNPDSLSPQGTVTFKDGGTVVGSSGVSNGLAFLIVTETTPGVHGFTAEFSGTANFAASTSSTANVTVQPAAASTITLLFPVVNPSAAGQAAPIVALVVPVGGAGTVTGSVQFKEGNTVLGTAALANGIATIAPTTLSVGQHQITARYLGNASFAASSSAPAIQTVYSGTAPKASSTAISVSPGTSNLGDPVTLTATVTPSAGTPTGTVSFFADSIAIGSAPVANVGGVFKAVLTTSALPRGAHLITASYGGSAAVASSNSLPGVAVVQ